MLLRISSCLSKIHFICTVLTAVNCAHDVCFFTLFSPFRLADELAAYIVDMRNHLGEKFLPLPKFYGFSRGMLNVGPQVLVAIQYYQEIPFYGPPRQCEEGKRLEITKFCEWKVAKGSKVSCFSPQVPPIQNLTDTSNSDIGVREIGRYRY